MDQKELKSIFYKVKTVTYKRYETVMSVTGLITRGIAYGERIDDTCIKVHQFNGDETQISISCITDVKATRMTNEKMRNKVVKLAEVMKKYDAAMAIISDIPEQKKKLKNDIAKLNGFYTENDFCEKLMKEISKVDFVKKLLRYNYNITFNVRGNKFYGVEIRLDREITRWPKPEEYSFVYREYDETLHLHDDHPSYKKTLNSMSSRHSCPITIKKKKTDKYSWNFYDYLYLTDKSLDFASVFSFNMNGPLTDKTFNDVVKLFKTI